MTGERLTVAEQQRQVAIRKLQGFVAYGEEHGKTNVIVPLDLLRAALTLAGPAGGTTP